MKELKPYTTAGNPRCCESVRDSGRWPTYHQCYHAGTEYEGKIYCKIHHPVNIKMKQEAKSKKWDLQHEIRVRARIRASMFPRLVQALKVAKNTTPPGTAAHKSLLALLKEIEDEKL